MIAEPSVSVRLKDRGAAAKYDRMLVARFKAGDESAFEEIVSRYRSRIYSMVKNLIHNEQDAEEVAADTFIRAHRCLKDFRGDSALSTWLYTIATNLARNRYWYWWRRKRDKSLSLNAPMSDSGGATFAQTMSNEDEGILEGLERLEFMRIIAECMKDLGQPHREILILRTVQNLSYAEIGGILRLTVGTVKSRIARARECLRELIREASGKEIKF